MFVKNRSQLESEDLDEKQLMLRRIALNGLEKAIEAVKPRNLVEKSLKIRDHELVIKNDVFNLNDFSNIYIIGAGKATAEMAFSLENILKDAIKKDYEGIINIPRGLEIKESDLTGKIKINFASHPIPDENGLKGAKLMMELIEKSTSDDLIFCLISGGGSALLPLPRNGMTLNDLKDVNSLLLASGASIHEINTIRKHLSDIKGGNLAKKLYHSSGATLISLIISDVVGDNLDSIASGPTVPDLTTFKDAIQILRKYNLLEKIPPSAKKILEEGLPNEDLETPKPDHLCFKNVHTYLIGSVSSSVQETISYLKTYSFGVEYFSNEIVGESREFGKKLFQIVSEKIQNNIERNKIALIGTGELTVTIKGKGIGGRNQEMLLSFLNYTKDKKFEHDFLIIAANLDGLEGNSKAMGALVDNNSLFQMKRIKIDPQEYLDNNDSNSFFKALKSEIITGPTGCNVNDLLVILLIP